MRIETIAAPADPTRSLGLGMVTRIREQGPPIDRHFDPPRADLLDLDFDALSDEEIAAL